jgi:hypothetical protein
MVPWTGRDLALGRASLDERKVQVAADLSVLDVCGALGKVSSARAGM